MKKIALIVLIGLLSLPSMAQTKRAETLFNEQAYAEAQAEYAKLLRSNPRSPLYLYRYARCAQELGDYPTAIDYFRRSGDKYKLAYLFTGDCYLALWQPTHAIEAYTLFLNAAPESDRANVARERLLKAEKLQRYMKRIERVAVIDSLRLPLSDLLQAYAALSPDAGQLSSDTAGLTTYTNQLGDRRIFAVGDSTGSVLMTCYRLLDKWAKADTLPQVINRAQWHNYPYCLSDGVTLYYAMQDSTGLGGWDIYVSRYNTGAETYTHPENIGMPFNSPANDYLLVIDEARQLGYWATDRFTGPDSVCVYTFRLSATPAYWRLPEDSLAAYAQLRRYDSPDEDATATSAERPLRSPETHAMQQFQLIINDTLVYSSMEDFRSPEAAAMYLEYLQAEQEYRQVVDRLEAMRRLYAANEEQRASLVSDIMATEQKERTLRSALTDRLNTLRLTELSAR